MCWSEAPVFGTRDPDVEYVDRPAAYVIATNEAGQIAAVRGRAGCWLPGGGIETGETAEECIKREVREEIGATLHITALIGKAVQYFHAPSDGNHYRMRATFFRGEFLDEPSSVEHELCWIDASGDGALFFHASHDWAARSPGSSSDEGPDGSG